MRWTTVGMAAVWSLTAAVAIGAAAVRLMEFAGWLCDDVACPGRTAYILPFTLVTLGSFAALLALALRLDRRR